MSVKVICDINRSIVIPVAFYVLQHVLRKLSQPRDIDSLKVRMRADVVPRLNWRDLVSEIKVSREREQVFETEVGHLPASVCAAFCVYGLTGGLKK